MKEVIKARKEITATEDDVNRALATVDTNNDDKINFDQFIKFMALFFANNRNLKQRIEKVITYLLGTEHKKAGSFLKPQEVADINNFVYSFYGKKVDPHANLKSKENIEYTSYLNSLEKQFFGLTFVKS